MAAVEQVVVGRIGRPHGVRGEVSIEVRTDEPDRRFQHGARLTVRPPRAGASVLEALTVSGTRWHQGRLLVFFTELADRTAAEALRNCLLLVDIDPQVRPEDPEEFYDHQLVGLPVQARDEVGDDAGGDQRRLVGTVAAVLHSGAQDVLVVRREDGREVMVPFVAALVPEVDVDAGLLVVLDRPGLLDPEE